MSYRVTIGYFDPLQLVVPPYTWTITIILPTANEAVAREWADRDIQAIETGTGIFVNEGPKVVTFTIFEAGDNTFKSVFHGTEAHWEGGAGWQ